MRGKRYPDEFKIEAVKQEAISLAIQATSKKWTMPIRART